MVLEAKSPQSRKRFSRVGSFWGPICPWPLSLTCGWPFSSLSLHNIFPPSVFPLCVEISSYKDIIQTRLIFTNIHLNHLILTCLLLWRPYLQISLHSQVLGIKKLPTVQETWVGKIAWRRAWQATPVFLPRESPRTEMPGGLQFMR